MKESKLSIADKGNADSVVLYLEFKVRAIEGDSCRLLHWPECDF